MNDLAYPISTDPAAQLVTIARYVRNVPRYEQICFVNLPKQASTNLVHAVTQIHIILEEHCYEEYDKCFKESLTLSDIFKPLTRYESVVYDDDDNPCSIENYAPLTQQRLEYLQNLSDVLNVEEVCAETVLTEIFDVLLSFKEFRHSEENALYRTNQDAAKLFTILRTHINNGITSLSDIPTLEADLASI